MIQNSLYQNTNREEVKNRDLLISLLLTSSLFFLVQRILNYYPNNPTHRLYIGEVETPY